MTMKQPFGASRPKQFVQKPALPTDQTSIADQDTVLHSAVYGSPPIRVSRPEQLIQKPGLPTNQPSVADQDTMPHSIVSSSSPVGVTNTAWPNQYTRKLVDQAP